RNVRRAMLDRPPRASAGPCDRRQGWPRRDRAKQTPSRREADCEPGEAMPAFPAADRYRDSKTVHRAAAEVADGPTLSRMQRAAARHRTAGEDTDCAIRRCEPDVTFRQSLVRALCGSPATRIPRRREDSGQWSCAATPRDLETRIRCHAGAVARASLLPLWPGALRPTPRRRLAYRARR